MLEIKSLSKHFGALRAVDDISVTVPSGSVLGIMGVNGAGKSTLLDCICGVLKPTSGEISLEGKAITGLPTHQINRLGLSRTFQVPRNFRSLTALENLLVAFRRNDDEGDAVQAALNTLSSVRLGDKAAHFAEELSGGQQKLLELARLEVSRPKMILLDEPFAGMHPELCGIFISRLKELSDRGVCMILVSHDPETLYRLSKTIIVMNQGRIIASGSPAEVKSNPAVIDAYLGG